MGRYAEAAQHLERSLAIGIKVHGTEEHPYVATILSNLGFVMQAMVRHEEAAKHYERSLAIRLKVHGTEEHPDVAASLSGLGTVLQKQGRIAEAATHYERSLAIYNKVHSGLHGTGHGNEEHPDVARSRCNLQSLHDLVSASNARPTFRNTRWLHVGITIFLSLFFFCVFLSFLFFSYVMLSFGEVGDKSCSAGPVEPKDLRARLTGFLGGNGGQETREKDRPNSRKEQRK
jgi:tetratricopeptide (TPR) repeat protein